jgi:hypothetical protein
MHSGARTRRRGALDSPGRTARRRVLAIATDAAEDVGLVDEICDGRPADELQVAVVAPAVEDSGVKQAIGDLDPARERARERLERYLRELRRRGVPALGILGDSDPALAEEDALRRFPADEVVHLGGGDGRARSPSNGGREVPLSPYLPAFGGQDLLSIVVGIAGTAATAILAAAGPGPSSAAGAAQILIAIGVALLNLAHIVGLTLFESVRYRGWFQTFFGIVPMAVTPAAVLANALILALV